MRSVKVNVTGKEVGPEFVLMGYTNGMGVLSVGSGIYLIHTDDLRDFQKLFPHFEQIPMADWTDFHSFEKGTP